MKRSDSSKHAKPRFGRHGYTIGARYGNHNAVLQGRAFFASTGAGSSVELTQAAKFGIQPTRETFRRPRARESKDLQTPRDARD